MERQVRYCTTADDVRIAYWIEGSGPAVLVNPIFVEAPSLGALVPEYEAFMSRLGRGRTLIRFDMRGTGLSQRSAPAFSQRALMEDMKAVLAAADVPSVSIWASTTAGPRSIAYAAEHPDEVDALILYGAYADLKHAGPTGTTEALRGFADLCRGNWDLASQVFADMTGRKEWPDAALHIGELYLRSCEGSTAGEIIDQSEFSAVELLKEVRCRTLVLHRVDDSLFPISTSQEIAAGIKSSRFVPLEGSGHACFLGDSSSVLEAVISFLDEDSRTAATRETAHPNAEGPFKTVLFTDLVGHTEMMRRLGDARGREVLREHERITRDLLKEFSGAEVKTMGDGFMASFGSVTKAMDCAIALQRAFAAHTDSMPEPLPVRIGLNAGEPIEEDGDLFGSIVILASRIAAKAGAGEILVPDTIRGLLSGKGFVFGDRGEFVPKGFDEGVRLWDVRWTE